MRGAAECREYEFKRGQCAFRESKPSLPRSEANPPNLGRALERVTDTHRKAIHRGMRYPGPIWPTLASLCAIPVLMIGMIFVSRTRRASMPAGVPEKLRAGRVHALLR